MFDGDLPVQVVGRHDFRLLIDTTVFNKAVCQYHEKPNQPWHHALYYAHRAGWLAWIDVNGAVMILFLDFDDVLLHT
ncbi:hypothetical protein TPL01_10390 [Sulfuriferula plumbiphila]|uniref:Uncharacterized protein n=1 Tax=Sulfuriferula plumbiphila TaxID=171865 RepID=A0A512L6X3_9PROT|nr:hypothetical protein [Sulfuriferula plumbiphila]BBP05158.1 hypothetical protein SFPGR_25800 [Sulfuriferula plumbiphila]GEP29901.1 hypothetical protein TPL01_10390 [Sulfuriferula plumbiphila]